MRRSLSLLFSFVLSLGVLAAEPNPRQPGSRLADLEHVILNVQGPLTAADRQELATKGVFVQDVLAGGGRYIARMARGRVVQDARIGAIETIEPEKKIAASAWREAGLDRIWAEVNVYFHADVQFDDARTALLASGAAIEPLILNFAPSNRLTAKIAPSQLNALASDDRVLAITGPIRFDIKADNAKTAALSHVTEVNAAPYGLTGAGVTVSLFELARAQSDHPEFGGRLTVQPSVVGGSGGNAGHATHVAGTIGAAGINAAAKGMAPGARIFQFCVRSGSNSCRNDFLTDKDTELTKVGARVDNNSWGFTTGWELEDLWVWNDGGQYYGAYDFELVAQFDKISLNRSVLFVHSAGNDGGGPSLPDWGRHRHVNSAGRTITDKVWCYSANGSGLDCPANICTGTDTSGANTACETQKHHTSIPNDTIGWTASGKNTIAVGSVEIVGTDIRIADYSSQGPAKDGRVKPDVVARGSLVFSTIPTNSYELKNGTSMASPAVTGIAALLIEQWRKSYGVDPTPAQLKALIIAGADDLGRPGPDFTFGHGLVNAKTSVDLIRDDRNSGERIRKLTVENSQQHELPIVVTATQNLRVVLHWGDPAPAFLVGEEFKAKALVNDLDVKVVGPDGTVHLPYVLDKNDFTANATHGVNTVDNTEVVEIKSASPGAYRVFVNGTGVFTGPQAATVVANARLVPVCTDAYESLTGDGNNAFGPIAPGQTIHAALCSQDDRDYYKFTTKAGVVSATFTTGDTAISVTGLGTPALVPANTTLTIIAVATGPTTYTMSVSPQGPIGVEPIYRFTLEFGQQTGPKRRAVR